MSSIVSRIYVDEIITRDFEKFRVVQVSNGGWIRVERIERADRTPRVGPPPQPQESSVIERPTESPGAFVVGFQSLPFGAHKGKPLCEVPTMYLDWLQTQAWVKPWTMALIRRELANRPEYRDQRWCEEHELSDQNYLRDFTPSESRGRA